ncbi:prephenate dehydrogenase [Streptomyces sp. NPDC093097]|uniref:prephenate dehydrogenase n=1 Tax=Streptomyces sp. NPDC093097 TaxID=3366027 RepID=UPI003821F954
MASALVIGAGLIGTSVALALSGRGVRVYLRDADPIAARTAAALGAGTTDTPSGPADVALLAVPPGQVVSVLASAQAAGLAHVYTDVASVKGLPLRASIAAGCDVASFVGGHPMAGRELSGPVAAQPDLFAGRPWILTPLPETSPEALRVVRETIQLCGATPVEMAATEHDEAMALVSHTPHLVSAVMAARLVDVEPYVARLAGQGLRDVVRIAGGGSQLWTDILAANATAVADVLDGLAEDLRSTISALRDIGSGTHRASGAVAALTDLLDRGRTGHRVLPGKHGTPQEPCEDVHVVIGDMPGELAQCLAAVGAAGVNVEDMELDQNPGRASGTVRLQVSAAAAAVLPTVLNELGWKAHGGTTAAEK